MGRAAVWKVVGCSLSAASQVFRRPPVGRISKGWGIRSPELIPRGSFVCEYVGEYIFDDEAESRGIRYDNQKMSRLIWTCTETAFTRSTCAPTFEQRYDVSYSGAGVRGANLNDRPEAF